MSNKEKKESRKFYKWIDNCLRKIDELSNRKKAISWVIFFLFIFGVSTVIAYIITTSKYQDEFNYPKESYEFLDKFAQTYIEEGKEYVDLENNLQVDKYEVIHKDNSIVLKAYLDDKKMYAEASSIEVELSKEYKILNTTYTYASKEEYIKDIRKNIIVNSLIIGLIVGIAMVILVLKLLVSLAHADFLYFLYEEE